MGQGSRADVAIFGARLLVQLLSGLLVVSLAEAEMMFAEGENIGSYLFFPPACCHKSRLVYCQDNEACQDCTTHAACYRILHSL